MTIEAAGNDAGPTWRAVCDNCGDDMLLDTDGNRHEAEAELRDMGWVARPAEIVRFPVDYSGTRKHAIEYREHDCPDCV